jgi:hypothetical protein
LRFKDSCLAFEFIKISKGDDMLGHRLGDGKKIIGVFKITEQVHSCIGKEGRSGHIKILKIIAMPHDLHGIQIMKRYNKFFLANPIVLAIHILKRPYNPDERICGFPGVGWSRLVIH